MVTESNNKLNLVNAEVGGSKLIAFDEQVITKKDEQTGKGQTYYQYYVVRVKVSEMQYATRICHHQ